MRYLLSFLCPPLAVLLCGRPMTALFNAVLCLFGFIPGIIHALIIVKERKDDKRFNKLAKAINKG